MQEDKEAIFDAVDTVKACLGIFAPMLKSMKSFPENMLAAARRGFINATDLADYLVKKGMPFRTAYKISGTLVSECIKRRIVLEEVTLDEYKTYSELFEADVFEEISLQTCVSKRISLGGTSQASADAQIEFIEKEINKI
jgi:argininosuccinate lyase